MAMFSLWGGKDMFPRRLPQHWSSDYDLRLACCMHTDNLHPELDWRLAICIWFEEVREVVVVVELVVVVVVEVVRSSSSISRRWAARNLHWISKKEVSGLPSHCKPGQAKADRMQTFTFWNSQIIPLSWAGVGLYVGGVPCRGREGRFATTNYKHRSPGAKTAPAKTFQHEIPFSSH